MLMPSGWKTWVRWVVSSRSSPSAETQAERTQIHRRRPETLGHIVGEALDGDVQVEGIAGAVPHLPPMRSSKLAPMPASMQKRTAIGSQ